MTENKNHNTHQNPDTKKRLLLIGGGHAHIQVIKSLNSQTRPSNLEITLVDLQSHASYSGMVPGCVAKLYDLEQVQIDLKSLAEWAGMEFVCGRMVGLSLGSNEKENDDEQTSGHNDGGGGSADKKSAIVEIYSEATTGKSEDKSIIKREIPFDVVSLDIGSTTRDFTSIPGAAKYAISTRPISDLVRRINKEEIVLQEKINKGEISSPIHVVVVGAGAAGIELSLAMRARWNALVKDDNNLCITLLDSNRQLVPSESIACRKALENVMEKYNIQVRHNIVVKEVTSSHIHVSPSNEKENAAINDGVGDDNKSTSQIAYTHCIWATGAECHQLSRDLHEQCGLSITERGWIQVNSYLQSISHPYIFAAGDCCEIRLDNGRKSPPKAGVYAVRSGPILIENLTRCLGVNIGDMVAYSPQEDFLKLLMCGDGTALGFRFGLPLYGKWVWKLKDTIDRMFMDLFDVNKLPPSDDNKSLDSGDDNDVNDAGGNDGKSNSYNTSQYDSAIDRPPPLEPEDAGQLLMRTDDDVDFQAAWNVLRDMMADKDYKADVLKVVDNLSADFELPRSP